MTEYNAEVEVSSGRHLRNVKVESVATSWFLRCAGIAVIVFAVAIFVSFVVFSYPHGVNPLFVVTALWAAFLGPAAGVVLILLPWIFKEKDRPTKRMSKRTLVVSALALVIAAASLIYIILAVKLV